MTLVDLTEVRAITRSELEEPANWVASAATTTIRCRALSSLNGCTRSHFLSLRLVGSMSARFEAGLSLGPIVDTRAWLLWIVVDH